MRWNHASQGDPDMSFRAFLAICLCRLLRGFSRLVHRGGTAMPGQWALRVCPNLLSILARGVKTVAITGTNGKTTTARKIEEGFARQGKNYVANRSGANLLSGVTAEFAAHSTLAGRCRYDYALIEATDGIEGMPAFVGSAPGGRGWHLGKATVDGDDQALPLRRKGLRLRISSIFRPRIGEIRIGGIYHPQTLLPVVVVLHKCKYSHFAGNDYICKL